MAMHGGYLAINIEFGVQALDHVAVFKSHTLAGVQPEESVLRDFPKVVTFYPQLARQWKPTRAPLGMMWMHRRVTFLECCLRKVVDDESERIENSECTRHLVVEIISKRTLQYADIDPPVDLGYSDALA